jgi:hypothetical protein
MASWPVSAKDRDNVPSQFQDDLKELLLSIQALFRLDTGLPFRGITEQQTISLVESSLKCMEAPRDESIQASLLRSMGMYLARMNNLADESIEELHTFLYHAAYANCAVAVEPISNQMIPIGQMYCFVWHNR